MIPSAFLSSWIKVAAPQITPIWSIPVSSLSFSPYSLYSRRECYRLWSGVSAPLFFSRLWTSSDSRKEHRTEHSSMFMITDSPVPNRLPPGEARQPGTGGILSSEQVYINATEEISQEATESRSTGRKRAEHARGETTLMYNGGWSTREDAPPSTHRRIRVWASGLRKRGLTPSACVSRARPPGDVRAGSYASGQMGQLWSEHGAARWCAQCPCHGMKPCWDPS